MLVREQISGSAHRVDGDRAGAIGEPAPEPTHIHFDDVGVTVEIVGPHTIENPALREDLSRVEREVEQHVELAGGRDDGRAADHDATRSRIDPEVTERQGFLSHHRSAQQRVKPRDQHREGEWLGEIVIGARIECFGFIEIPVLRRQHQNGNPISAGTEIRTDKKSIVLRQHDVENHRVVGKLRRAPNAF